MWEDKPLHREMLLWSQCSQQTGSPAKKTRKTESHPKKSQSKWLEWNYSNCSPKIKLKMPRVHFGSANDRPETTKLPPIPEVVWQQTHETHSIDIHKNSLTNINNSTQTPDFKRKNNLKSKTSPIKETSPQVSGSDTESLLENQTRSTPVQCPNDSKKQQHEIQRNETDMATHDSGDDNIPPPELTTSQIEERLVRDDITKEICMPLASIIVLKGKKFVVCPSGFQEWLNNRCPCWLESPC